MYNFIIRSKKDRRKRHSENFYQNGKRFFLNVKYNRLDLDRRSGIDRRGSLGVVKISKDWGIYRDSKE